MGDLLTISDPDILRRAWGRRRVSSRADDGTQVYPSSVTAHVGLWERWFREIEAEPEGVERVVVTTGKAMERIALALADLDLPPPPKPMSQQEIDRLMHQRFALRSERKFAEADAIRDRLIAAGVVVADARQNPQQVNL